ncbi:SpaA isopeptide-forming pilin-related protein, partial [Turicibacter sanguinis]|uniref:SpaA isopeptide-forming pilin-related protein n=1 Tax=Turicibacter sanguinis TaxID=154288 RepID=UPI003999AE8C
MKKLLNVTLALSLVFQSFLGTGLVQATTTNESIVIEQVEESENLNEPVLEDVVEQEPIAKDEVVNESEVTEDIEIPPKEEHREVESESTDVSEENEEMNAESETVENEVVEDATLEENQLVADEVLLDDVEQEMEYGGDDYIIIQSDGTSPRATAVVREAYRIKNTAYNFTSIKSNWWTLRGMPKLTAEAWGTIYTAFCVEPGIVHENGGNMDSSDINGYNSLTWPQREKINQIMMYGYGNNGDYSDDSYVATQAAIWEVVANHPSWGTIWGQLIQKHSNRDRIYNEIWSNIGTHGVIPSFMGRTVSKAPIISLKWNGSAYTATLTDTNGVLSKYQVISNNGDVQVSQNGNQLTLTTTNPNADVTLRLSKQGSTGGNTLYWVSGKQDVVTGGQDDPVHAYLKINVQSVGNVNLIKKSVTGEVIPNTQFRVVGNGIDTVVTTGANGEILVSNLIAGTYTVTEVSVPSPYILDTTPKIVEIKPNTTSSVEFINNVAKGRVEVLKTSETGGLVQGAIFEIRQNGKVIETITTGKDGIATSSKLSLGTYEVVETFVPSPLILDSTPKQVTLTYANMNTPVVVERVGFVNELAKAQIKVTKHGVNGEPVEGAKFEIKNADGKVVETLTTNAKGEATTPKLPLGTYTATEIYVPSPYILDPTPQTIQLNYVNMTTSVVFGTLDFINEKAQGYFKLQKVDNETGLATPQGAASLENAVYEVRNDQGVVVDTLTTDKNGYVESKLLPLGDYTIQEIKASEGYLVDSQTYKVALVYVDQNTPIVTTSVKSNEQVMKQPIEIMKVEGEVSSTWLNKLVNFFTRSSGVMKPLEGAEFTITLKTTGKVVDVMVTDKNGYAKSIDLPYDTYIISETKVPHNHYKADDFEVVINQNSNKPLHYTVANKPVTAYLKVIKIDEETKQVIPLAGVKFKIKNLDTGDYVKQKVTYPYPHTIEVFETNDEGMFITPKVLIYGNYQVEEVEAPNGYVLLQQPIKFTIDQNDTFIDDIDFGLIKEVVVSNQATKGQLAVHKVGEFLTDFKENETGIEFIIEELSLAGVTFNIYAREDVVGQEGTVWYKKGEFVETVTTSEDGEAKSSKLPLGKYFVTEIQAPNGYILDGVEYDFELAYENQENEVVISDLDVFNTWQSIKVNLTKVGEQQNGEYAPLSNVKFGLYAKEDIKLSDSVTVKADTLIQTQTTDQEGNLSFETKLPLGTYYVQEISADENYVVSDKQYDFTFEGLLQEQPVIEININNGDVISNELVRGGFELTKKSETGEVLAEVDFELYSKFKEHLGTFTTDENGQIRVENLIYGDYLLVESKSANGHQILTTPIKVEIRENNVIVPLKAVNKLTVTEILKVDKNGNPLVGATLQVLDLDGKVVEEWISTEKPHEILGLKHQKYILHEVSAPSGYRLMEDVEFEVTEQAETLVIQAINEYTEVHIDKYDPSGNKLLGATMQIIDKVTGEVVHEWRTTDETKVIEGLPHGDYILREITAPDGFQKILDIEFTVTDENTVTVFEIVDELTRVEVDKYDPSGNKLLGATMQI